MSSVRAGGTALVLDLLTALVLALRFVLDDASGGRLVLLFLVETVMMVFRWEGRGCWLLDAV